MEPAFPNCSEAPIVSRPGPNDQAPNRSLARHAGGLRASSKRIRALAWAGSGLGALDPVLNPATRGLRLDLHQLAGDPGREQRGADLGRTRAMLGRLLLAGLVEIALGVRLCGM